MVDRFEGEPKSLKGEPALGDATIELAVLLRFMDFNFDHRVCFGDSSLDSGQREVRWIENGNRGFGSLNKGPRCGDAAGVEADEPDFLDLSVEDFGFGGAEKRIVDECFIERTIVDLGVGEWERMNWDNGETAASKLRRNVSSTIESSGRDLLR